MLRGGQDNINGKCSYTYFHRGRVLLGLEGRPFRTAAADFQTGISWMASRRRPPSALVTILHRESFPGPWAGWVLSQQLD